MLNIDNCVKQNKAGSQTILYTSSYVQNQDLKTFMCIIEVGRGIMQGYEGDQMDGK